jgi:hypothetical protein
MRTKLSWVVETKQRVRAEFIARLRRCVIHMGNGAIELNRGLLQNLLAKLQG